MVLYKMSLYIRHQGTDSLTGPSLVFSTTGETFIEHQLCARYTQGRNLALII